MHATLLAPDIQSVKQSFPDWMSGRQRAERGVSPASGTETANCLCFSVDKSLTPNFLTA